MKTHNVAAEYRDPREPMLCLAWTTLVEDLVPGLEACHWLDMAFPFRWPILSSKRSGRWRNTRPMPLTGVNECSP
jgi:hypothetical protein